MDWLAPIRENPFLLIYIGIIVTGLLGVGSFGLPALANSWRQLAILTAIAMFPAALMIILADQESWIARQKNIRWAMAFATIAICSGVATSLRFWLRGREGRVPSRLSAAFVGAVMAGAALYWLFESKLATGIVNFFAQFVGEI